MGVPPTPSIDGAAGLPLWLPGAAVANDIARSQTRPLNDEPNVGRKGRMQSAANGKERRDGSHAYPGGTRAKTEVGKGADTPRDRGYMPDRIALAISAFPRCENMPLSFLSRSSVSCGSMLAKTLQGLLSDCAIRSHEQRLRVCERWCS